MPNSDLADAVVLDSADWLLSKTRSLGPLPGVMLSGTKTDWLTALSGGETGANFTGQMIGRYRVERVLGRGGMGVVLLAHDRDLGRFVALKLLWANDPQVLARFRLEATALAGLSHDNIVRVFEFGDAAGRPYLAMEYVEGQSLFAALRDGPLEPRAAAALLQVVAGAVHAAHTAGVIHRDLKPANVLLDALGVPKVTDFGIAKRLDSPGGLTETHVAIGTPAYMAPEQAACGATDARTDVYGLGATLYECLTGRPLFAGPSLEVLRQVADDEPVPPSRLNRAVSRDLETICLKCLAKDPARRYASAEDLAAELARFTRGEPILARPVSPSERALRWCRRHKTVTALAAVALVSLVGGTTMAMVQAYRANAARQAESVQRQAAEAQRAEADAERGHALTAEAAARAGQRLAEEKAGETAAINAFLLEDLLKQASSRSQANARFAANPKLTVREALDRAAERVGERFQGRPALEEAIRTTLGASYMGVGANDQAVKQLRLALTSRTARLGTNHRETLTLMNGLARACLETGRHAEATPLLKECLRLSREHLGPGDRDTLAALSNWATLHRSVSDPRKAIAIHEECLALRRASLGANDPDTLNSMSNLAEHYRAANRLAEALPLAEESLRRTRAARGPSHPDVLAVSTVLSMIYREQGRKAEMLPLCEEILQQSRSQLGPDHPQTLSAMNTLALAYQSVGRRPEALPLLEASWRGHQQSLGPDNPSTLTVMYNLGIALMWSERPVEAVPLFEACLRHRRVKLGAGHPETLNAMCSLVTAYRETNRRSESVPVLEEALRETRKTFGADNPQTVMVEANLAVVYREVQRSADAVPLYQNIIRQRRTEHGHDHPQTLRAMTSLAATFEEAGRPAEALPLYEAAWQAWSVRAPLDPEAVSAQTGLGKCLMTLKQFAVAEAHLQAVNEALIKNPTASKEQRAASRKRLDELSAQRKTIVRETAPAPRR